MRKLFIFLFVLILCVFLTYILSKSRTFQLFGNLINKIDTNEKIVALTFDDCPNQNLESLLNVLSENDVYATFFIPGNCIEKDPETIKSIVNAGHSIGNHSYSHKRMIFKSTDFIAEEIEKTNELIRSVGYSGEITFRPPNGKKLILLPLYLKQNNIKTIMWNIEPDTYNQAKTPEDYAIYTEDYINNNISEGSIILLHPFCELCAGNITALETVIPHLKGAGYRFVTIDEVIKYLNQT